MKALIQRVKEANLSVGGKQISKIGKGLVVFFCVNVGDTEDRLDYFAKKIVNMRIFEKNGKIDLSSLDIGGEILVVSQFTLAANCSHGNRPDFLSAEKPERANMLYEKLCDKIASYGVKVSRGVFGEDMQILQLNDGPFSVILE